MNRYGKGMVTRNEVSVNGHSRISEQCIIQILIIVFTLSYRQFKGQFVVSGYVLSISSFHILAIIHRRNLFP